MQNVYFISGLGADKRTFSFLDLSFCNPIFIDWLIPNKQETITSYAQRIREIIAEEHPIIVGLSFGGMVVTEMAKADNSVKGIIISSNKKASEFPYWLRIGKWFPLYKWVPNFFYNYCSFLTFWFLGAKGKEERKLVKKIIASTDIGFSKWAIEAIMNWTNETIPINITHIHGTSDKLLPYHLVQPPLHFTINKGEHLMIMDQAKDVSILLKQIIMNR